MISNVVIIICREKNTSYLKSHKKVISKGRKNKKIIQNSISYYKEKSKKRSINF